MSHQILDSLGSKTIPSRVSEIDYFIVSILKLRLVFHLSLFPLGVSCVVKLSPRNIFMHGVTVNFSLFFFFVTVVSRVY